MSASPVADSGRDGVSWIKRADAIVANPVVAYCAILALQLRLLWKVWDYKDLTSGDTAGYFLDAISWTHGLHDDIVWSPLYTNFLGSLDALFGGDVYQAVLVHRIAIVLGAALLVLALMRRLLGPAVGLLVTLWWVVSPQNFNPLYEVHLFGLLPLLVAALVVARWRGRGGRGAALGILLATTLVMRNETIIATLVFGAAIVVAEIREARGRRPSASASGFSIRPYLRSYGIPIALACLLAGTFYARSFTQGNAVSQALRAKTGLNLCQSYAFNYQQRHPSKFTGNAFTECQPLMRQVFGAAEPNFTEAAVNDPRAMAAYIAWNGRLLASGLQVALFDATATGDQPDYPPVQTHRTYALILSIAFLLLLALGGWAIVRERRRSGPLTWVLILLGALTVTTLAVVLTERPRPEYMYPMTIGIMALSGACLSAVLRRGGVSRFTAPVGIVLTAILLAVVPPFYSKGPRPLRAAVGHLQIVRGILHQPRSVLIAGSFNFELCSYLAETHKRHCSSPSWPGLAAGVARGEPIRQVLDRAKASVIYAEPVLLANPAVATLVGAPARYGWRQLGAGSSDGQPWHILVRSAAR
ncbi:MAG: hypothetical protein JWM60_1057 [Solirubrobacterales bacterium]|nr:hypothetical protein [Solirubrobacterales bacterium]